MSDQLRFFADIYLTAFLLTQGFSLEKVEENGDRLRFGFTANAELDKAVRAFVNDQALVSPAKLQDALTRVKNIVFSYHRK